MLEIILKCSAKTVTYGTSNELEITGALAVAVTS
jgi:hypothetical protein